MPTLSPPSLTPRQLELLTLLADGYRLRPAAESMCIASSTAKGMAHEIRLRLGANSNPHAVTIAIRLGLIVPDSLPL